MIPSKTFIISPVPATLYTNEQLPQRLRPLQGSHMISKRFETCDCATLSYGGVVGGVSGNANDAAMGVIESGRIADPQYWTAVWKVLSELTSTVEMDANDSVQVGLVGGSSAAASAQSLLS